MARARCAAKWRRVDAKSDLLLPALAADAGGPLLIARRLREDMPRDTPLHAHARGQLLGALTGLLTVETAAGRWLVGPDQAIWAPPNSPHGLRSHGPFAGWSLYLARPACERLPTDACVLGTTPLLRALTERAAEWPPDATFDAVRARLAAVLLDEVAGLRRQPVSLPTPLDPRLRRVAAAIAADPADARGLGDWAELACVSPRSLTRLFAKETGTSLSCWRQRARLLTAQERLARGDPVTCVASAVGYDSPSAFSAAFRRAFGLPPLGYVAGLRGRSARG